MKLQKILQLEPDELKALKKTDPTSYELYSIYMRTFVNRHSTLLEFKRKLSIKLLQENQDEIIDILTKKIENKKERSLEDEIKTLEKRIANMQAKLEDLTSEI